MSKPKTVEELARELEIMRNDWVNYKIVITDWLESESKLPCPYCGSTDTVSTEVADIGKCLNPICKHKLFLIKSKQYATGEL